MKLIGYIICPTLIIGGKEDNTLSSKNSELIHEKVTHSSLKILDGVGHCSLIEAPETINQLMAEFLQSIK